MSKFQVLIDSDAFVGNSYPDDPHHLRAMDIFARLEKERRSIVTTNLVVLEVATVLSHRSGQPLAVKFLDMIENRKVPVIHLDEKLQKSALNTFRDQTARGTSVTDCSNVVVMDYFNIPEIFSFDRVYAKAFGLKTVA